MKKSRFTETQIVAMLKEADAEMRVEELCLKHGISSASYYDWKKKYGGMDASEIKRLKELKEENANLKLTYNSTNLKGWIDEQGNLKLYDDNNRWNYHFSGMASGSTIGGEWSVDGAPCRGTWKVERR